MPPGLKLPKITITDYGIIILPYNSKNPLTLSFPTSSERNPNRRV